MSQFAVAAPPTTPAQGEWTYEDFLKLPDDGRRNGEYALLGEYTGDERLQSLVLAGIDIVTSTLFG